MLHYKGPFGASFADIAGIAGSRAAVFDWGMVIPGPSTDRPPVALGIIGLLMSIAGQIAIIRGDLAPRWYGWALIILALPITGFGGWLYAPWNKMSRVQ